MADAFLEKATSALSEAKESVATTADSVKASLTDAEKTVATSTETARSTLTEAGSTVAASAETVKTEAAAAPEKVSGVSTQARDAVDSALSRGIEGAKSLLQTFEEKRTEVSSKLVGAVSNAVGGASSSTVANRDLPVSTDNQPLLASGETTPWWKNCCGVLDLFKKDTTS
ncbi:hypothetical protein CARUB_v10024186mg [Capsella rubella]|uniref:Uncharacterized protein n=1 Tax=Capsella rubella TaxID=81985 RepID=R0HEK8_9BRAS|nr:uncharacterized protein LOC17890160 [Capsella rubella]EOA28009.1 hypothetical protein CARUB_v10024186mg [Capsella rubella]